MLKTSFSLLQDKILDALPPRPLGDHIAPDAAISTAKVMQRIGISNPTNSDRAAVSRSLARLAARGLALRWGAGIHPHGRGFLWSRAKERSAHELANQYDYLAVRAQQRMTEMLVTPEEPK